MVYVDVPGLPKDFNVKFRPPRVSLFPPSYRDRAYLRSIHRDVLRQLAAANDNGAATQTVTIPPASGDEAPSAPVAAEEAPVEPVAEEPPPEAITEKAPEVSMTGCQTIESYCYHECNIHKSGKKDQKGDSKNGKNQGSTGKKQDNKKKDNDDVDADSDQEDDLDKAKNKNGKQGGGNKSKKDSKDDSKKDDSKFQIPDALKTFLPYPFTSSNADAFWGNSRFSRPFPEKPFTTKQDPSSWNLDYKLEAARRADEKYMWNWLGQADSATQRDAFQWLADRDVQRQARLAQASHDLAGLSLDPGFGFGGGLPTPSAPLPNIPTTPRGRPVVPNHGADSNNSSLTAYVDQQGNIRLSDGRIVNVQQQGGCNSPRAGLFNHAQRPFGGQDHCVTGGQAHVQQKQQGCSSGQQQQQQQQQQPLQAQRQGFQQGFQGGCQTPSPRNHQQSYGFSHNPNAGWNAAANNQKPSGGNAQLTNQAQNNTNQDQRPRSDNGHWNNQAAGNNAGGGFFNSINDSGNNNAGRMGASPNHNNHGRWGETAPNNNVWGNGNDENCKPNNFGNFNNNQNNGKDAGWDNNSLNNHPFFAKSPPQMPCLDGAGGGSGEATMSGAKRMGRGQWNEPQSW